MQRGTRATPTGLRRWRGSCLAFLVLACLSGARASAATFQVDTTADTAAPPGSFVWDAHPGDGICADTMDACTLRAAIQEANARPGADVVRVPPGHYVLWTVLGAGSSARTLFVEENDTLTIEGSGAATTVVDGSGYGTVIAGYGGGTLVLSDLTITGGGFAGGSVLFYSGGGIGFFGSLELSHVAVIENVGGAVWAVSGKVVESLVAGNSGSPSAVNLGDALVLNSTISGNTSRGRVVCAPPGYVPTCWCEYPPAAVSGRIVFSTIADNRVDLAPCSALPLVGAPPHALAGRFRGSLISNPGLTNCAGAQESDGHNLDSDGSCGLSDPTDRSDVDPMLGALATHRGPPPTHLLLRGSPALNAVAPEDCTYDDDGDPATPEVPVTRDQRGVPRPQGAGCDIGALERGACGLGAELAVFLPLMERARRRRTIVDR